MSKIENKGFFEKFSNHNFKLLAIGASNWDFYLMEYPNSKGTVVSINKDGIGAGDSFFGDLPYFKRFLNSTSEKVQLTEFGNKIIQC